MKKNFVLTGACALAVALIVTTTVSAHVRPITPKIKDVNLTLSADTVVQFVPVTVGPYCPKKLMGGDREFGGHGPEIWAWIKLKVVSKKYIDAEIYLHARETTSDWSETEGTWTKRLYTAPAGHEIVDILTGKYSEVHYVSKPGVNAFSPAGLVQAIGGAKGTDVPFKDDGLVTRWNIVGDTGGGDISDDDNPNDDTQVAVQLNPIKVRLKQPAPKPKAPDRIIGEKG